MLTFFVVFLLVVAVVIVVGVSLIVGFVKVPEGFYVAFKDKGEFVYGAMSFKDYHLELNGTVAPNPGNNFHGSSNLIFRWGGWVFYIRPFIEAAKYADYNDPADGFGKGVYVRLGDVTSSPYTSQAETTEPSTGRDGPGSIGVNMSFTSKMRVCNPRLFLFKSPRNVIKEAVEDRQDGVLRAWVFNGDRRHAQSAKGNGAKLWAELKQFDLLTSFDEARDGWGLEIVPNSIIVKEVKFDSDYENALKAESQQKLVAKGEKARIFDPITGAMDDWVTSQMPSFPGKIRDEVVAILQTPGAGGTPSAYELKEQEKSKLRSRALAGSNFSISENRLDISSGGKPIDPNYAAILATAETIGGVLAGKRGPGGRGNRGGNPTGGNPGGRISGPDPQIKAAEQFFGRYGVYPKWDPQHRTPVEP